MLPGPKAQYRIPPAVNTHIAVVHADKIVRQQEAGVPQRNERKPGRFAVRVFRQRCQPPAPVFGLFNIDIGQPFQRRAQADDPGDVRRPCFQFP